MTTELQDRPMLSEPEFEYKSVSLLSVLAFVLGLASILALLSPVGWIVPFAGSIVSLVATIRVHCNADRFTGKKLAMIGMCLSLWLGAWAPTKYFADRQFLSQSSAEYTEQWLNYVVAGDIEIAHQATLEFRFRQPLGTDLKEHYRTSEIDRADMNEYFSSSEIKDVVSRPEGTTIRKQRIRTISREKQIDNVVNIYVIEPPNDEPITLAVEVLRQKHRDNFYWRISGSGDPVELFGEE